MQQYTIQIRTNDPSKNEPPFSAHCKELGVTTDDFSIAAALSGLFSCIEIIEEDIHQEKTAKTKTKVVDFTPNTTLPIFSVPKLVAA